MREPRVYGYVRVSTKEQNEARQMEAMYGVKVPEKNIYCDKQSGKDFDRPQYITMTHKLREEDTLYIMSIDRLGRNYKEILEQWRYLTQVKKVNIVVLDMPLLDTREKDGDLTGEFISDLVLQILSYVSQNERENIHKRQAEGIKAAHSRGVKFGRPRKRIPKDFPEIVARWRNKEITHQQALEESGMSYSRFFYTIKDLGL
ncbi:MAG: recombinase family protein [Lachnospiraceae bacterium]|nr:recombinase family protein [Lachnospiraceae bacterium]